MRSLPLTRPLLKVTGLFLLTFMLHSCNKRICPDYWDPPDCETASGEKFYGVYKGISILDGGQQVITQWSVSGGPDVSQVCLAPDLILQLHPRDARSFIIKDRSFLGNNMYIRSEKSQGIFMQDSLSMEFWMDEGQSVETGEKLFHYSFKGRKL